jgi:tRNA(Ile)-lysidine synthase
MESLQLEFSPLRGKRCLVAFSGGADSLFLLEFIKTNSKNLGIEMFAAAHVNHGLRGLESERDFEFCKNYCNKNNIDFFSHKLGLAEGNTESWARAERYNYFDSLLRSHSFDFILTGHHLNDQVETVLMRLDRGSHFKGLRGIHKLDLDRHLYRPLLKISKLKIVTYLTSRNIVWREDLSNQEVTYTRNTIRKILMTSNMESEFNNTLVRISFKASRVYSKVKLNCYETCFDESKRGLELTKLEKLPLHLQNWVIGEFLQNMKLKIPNRLSPLKSVDSSLSFPGSWKWKRKKDILGYELEKNKAAEYELKVLLNLKTESRCCFEWANKEFVIGIGKNSENKEHWKEKFCTFLNISNLEEILSLRLKLNGDLFCPPNYQSHSRKLKKFLQDKKVQGRLKKQLWVLARGKDVLWIPGIATCFQNENSDSNNKIMNRESFWICQKII